MELYTIVWFTLSASSSMIQGALWSEQWLGLGETSSEFIDPSWHKVMLLAPQVSLLFVVFGMLLT